MSLARVAFDEVLDHVFDELAAGRGGWLITANLDFLRRHVRDPESRELYAAADLRVADGMPLVWASRAQGTPLPGRIAGSSLFVPLVERAARARRSIYLLGGEPGANAAAAALLRARWPDLDLRGASSPMVSSPPSATDLADLRREVVPTAPDLLLVGMGSPKQEQIIRALRADLPRTWMIGVGISFSLFAGQQRRAPEWMQRAGLEWCWRLAQDPRRLARRYLVEDLPFSFELFAHVLRRRLSRSPGAEGAAGPR
jgi:N-acetylglucosaminyldiphosphoundecaprenol N-acetyl-beta-D-mannosaminyltransferase